MSENILTFLSLRGGASVPLRWNQADLCHCLDKWNAAEVTLVAEERLRPLSPRTFPFGPLNTREEVWLPWGHQVKETTREGLRLEGESEKPPTTPDPTPCSSFSHQLTAATWGTLRPSHPPELFPSSQHTQTVRDSNDDHSWLKPLCFGWLFFRQR